MIWESSEEKEITPRAEVFAIGMGECGSNLVGAYLKKSKEKALPPRIRGYLLMNTDRADIQKVRTLYDIPKAHTLLYGESDTGVGGKFSDGYSYIHQSKDIILDQLTQLGYEGVSGFVIFTSLGGGTGCGGTPALVEVLKHRFEVMEQRRIFIYVIGVLPFKNQSSEAVNTVWAVTKLLRNQLQDIGPDLIVLISNRAMLKRILSWRSGVIEDFLSKELEIDVGDMGDIEKLVPSTLEEDSQDAMLKQQEQTFIDLVNPLALEVTDYMLSPGVVEQGKRVFPTTDLADYSHKLDPIIVPCLYTDVGFIPSAGNIPAQFQRIVDHTVNQCSYTEIGKDPRAESVYYVFSGPSAITRPEFDMHVKSGLQKYVLPGAAITPCFVQFTDQEKVSNDITAPDKKPASLLVLLGLPKIPEFKDILFEASQLIKLHTGPSPIKREWFRRSKGTTRDALEKALADLKELFGYYMFESPQEETSSGESP
ncbi:MAG: hypothetical protein ACFFCD_10065 [Promethearchaeota archaeon]